PGPRGLILNPFGAGQTEGRPPHPGFTAPPGPPMSLPLRGFKGENPMRGVLPASPLAVFVLSLLTPSLSFAGETAKDHMSGTIVSVDTKAGNVVVRDEMKHGNKAKETTFHMSKDPRVLVGGQPARLEDLKPGQQVKVAFKVDGKKYLAHT